MRLIQGKDLFSFREHYEFGTKNEKSEDNFK